MTRYHLAAMMFAGVVVFLPACKVPDRLRGSGDEKSYTLHDPKPVSVEHGIASWYGGRWIGRLTANGERYKPDDMTAAHKTLPFHTKVRVVDKMTGNSVIVRINNRGPYIRGRIIDLSVAAAKKLGTYHRGIARVRVEVLREIPVMSEPNLKVEQR